MPPVQITSLEQHLVLLAWLNRQLGYEHNRDLLTDTKEAAEGFDAEGRSYVYHQLIGRGDAVKISPDALARYDDNIRNHLRAMNARRSEPITLRYWCFHLLMKPEVTPRMAWICCCLRPDRVILTANARFNSRASGLLAMKASGEESVATGFSVEKRRRDIPRIKHILQSITFQVIQGCYSRIDPGLKEAVHTALLHEKRVVVLVPSVFGLCFFG